MTSTSQAATHGSQIPSRFDANNWRGQVCRYSGYRYVHTPAGTEWEYPESPEPGESCSYSDFTPDTDGRYFLSDFLSGSDYSGSIVERANYKDFLEDFGNQPLRLKQKKTSAVMNLLKIPADLETLATYLQRKSFRTGGFIGIWTVTKRFGYDRGFDVYEDEMSDYYGPTSRLSGSRPGRRQ